MGVYARALHVAADPSHRIASDAKRWHLLHAGHVQIRRHCIHRPFILVNITHVTRRRDEELATQTKPNHPASSIEYLLSPSKGRVLYYQSVQKIDLYSNTRADQKPNIGPLIKLQQHLIWFTCLSCPRLIPLPLSGFQSSVDTRIVL